MTNLVDFVVTKHGGAKLWKGAETISATVDVYGVFWPYKGQPDLLGLVSVMADLRRQQISMSPYGEGRTLNYDAAEDVVTITDTSGAIVDRLEAPRASMAGYEGDTPWSPTQMGYFISYATWIYLLEPLLFTLPGVETRELEHWSEDGETWRRLEVTFPDTISSHSKVQTYYFDATTGLQRRMDYDVEVNGWAAVGHYTSEHHVFDGLVAPTRRRVMLRDQENITGHGFAGILIDLSDIRING